MADAAPSPDTPPVAVVVVIFTVVDGGPQVLLIHRRAGPHVGRLALPGCRLNPAHQSLDSPLCTGAGARRVRAAAEAGGATGYPDYRSLVVEQAGEKLEALFVALEPFESVEYLTLAATHGINVFHQAPAGRNVEEASAAASAVARCDRLLTVGRYFSADAAYAELGEIEARIGPLHLATVGCQCAAPAAPGSPGRRARAPHARGRRPRRWRHRARAREASHTPRPRAASSPSAS